MQRRREKRVAFFTSTPFSFFNLFHDHRTFHPELMVQEAAVEVRAAFRKLHRHGIARQFKARITEWPGIN
jgi:hypothetical protein